MKLMLICFYSLTASCMHHYFNACHLMFHFFAFSQYQSPPPFLLGGQLLVPNFEKGGDYQGKKMSAWVDLKSSCHGYLPRGGGGGAYYVSSQKWLLKINGFEGSISNVNLGLFQPNNQLMFSFVTFWFC